MKSTDVKQTLIISTPNLRPSVSKFVNHAAEQANDDITLENLEKKSFPQITLLKLTHKQAVSKEYLHHFHVFYGGLSLYCPLIHPPVGPLAHCFHLLLAPCKPSPSKQRLEHPCSLTRRAVPGFVPMQSRRVNVCGAWKGS